MEPLTIVQAVLSREVREVLYECRRCGTGVERGTDTCPCCGSIGIARYVLE